MSRIGYILKVYPRFSETFVVTEILGREAVGDDISIFALRPTTDTRFHPELARVKAPVQWIPRPSKVSGFWDQMRASLTNETIRENFTRILPELSTLAASDVIQGITLAERALAEGVTHFHAHFASLAGRMAWVASNLTGIGYTVTTHAKDIFHEEVDSEWLRRICAGAEQVIAISQFNRRYLEEVLAGTDATIVLRYNALELERFPFSQAATADGTSAGAAAGKVATNVEATETAEGAAEGETAPRDTLQIAAVGRLVPKKGFANLIDAARQLKVQGVDFHIKIAGEGELEQQLKAQIAELDLANEVEMLGPLTQAEVTELNRAADVFVAPCVPAEDGNMDGLPTVVLEAMAVGTPVIATAVTGLPEVIRNGESGVLLEPGDVHGLAQALIRFAEHSVDTSRLTNGARAIIEEHFDNREQARVLSALEGGAAALEGGAAASMSSSAGVAASVSASEATTAVSTSEGEGEVA